jgi:glycosyltransferase involved in cell wall biosynthesis
MKILHVLNELKYSGAEVMYVSAAEEFKKLGYELYVVNTASKLGEYSSHFKEAGYEILHWPFKKNGLFNLIKYIQSVISFLKNEKIDIVHIHRADMYLTMSFCAQIAGCKSIYTFHNVFPSNWYSYHLHILQRWGAKKLLNCTFQTISNSVYLHEKNYYYNNTILVYNWYDSKLFFPASKTEKSQVRGDLGLPLDALVIISIGGCSHIKRHSDIIKSLPKVINMFPNSVYLHLGEGEELNHEIQLANDLGVNNNVRFEGNKSYVRQYLVASDIYIMPSKHEGIPITAIEALACKIPAILYDVPGLRDFNYSNDCVTLIKEDFELLAKTIISLTKDGKIREKLSDNGISFVTESFDMVKNVAKIHALYLK